LGQLGEELLFLMSLSNQLNQDCHETLYPLLAKLMSTTVQLEILIAPKKEESVKVEYGLITFIRVIIGYEAIIFKLSKFIKDKK
jgi:hypothetical protein